MSIKNNTIPVKGINSIINRNTLTSNLKVYLPFHKNKCDGSRINFHTASGLRASQEKGLNAFFVSGFVDGEGCFLVNVRASNKYKNGWRVEVVFKISLHKKDKALLEEIKTFFGVGNISELRADAVQYTVYSATGLVRLIDHFDRYPLITQKQADYLLFKEAVGLVNSKQHLTIKGLHQILSLKHSINRGISPELKAAFPEIVPTERPVVPITDIQDPNWLSGFVSAEGSFMVSIRKSSNSKLGSHVQLIFSLAQHSRDEHLIKSLMNYLECGTFSQYKEGVYFKVTKFSDICNKIVPFFDKFPIQGVKYKDYLDFIKIKNLVESKAHLTETGLNIIIEIKSGMNRARMDNIS